jgi:hypothetical protein
VPLICRACVSSSCHARTHPNPTPGAEAEDLPPLEEEVGADEGSRMEEVD